MTGYGAPAVSSPEASLAVPTIASASNRPLPQAALILVAPAADYHLGSSERDPGACPVVLGCQRRQALRGQVLRRRRCDQMTPYPLRKRAERCSASAG